MVHTMWRHFPQTLQIWKLGTPEGQAQVHHISSHLQVSMGPTDHIMHYTENYEIRVRDFTHLIFFRFLLIY